MKQAEFMAALMNELRELNEEDKNQLTEYYNELIMDGLEMGKAEEEIIAEFGPPNEAAVRIRKEYAEYGQFLSALPEAVKNSKTRDYQAGTDIQTVVIEAQNIPVEVMQSTGTKVQVLFSPKDGIDEVTSSTVDKTYTFIHKMRSFFFLNLSINNIFSWLQGQRKIYVELPADFRGNLYVKTSNAALTIKVLQSLENAKLITSNGRINIKGLTCRSSSIKTSNGPIDMDHVVGNEIEAVTSNARITAENCTMSNGMILTTKNGAITVRNLQSDKIVLKSCNAAITGTILGDMREYSIQSRTSNGANNLPNCSYPDQKKDLVVNTSNGRIHLEFVR